MIAFHSSVIVHTHNISTEGAGALDTVISSIAVTYVSILLLAEWEKFGDPNGVIQFAPESC